ncbi:26S proteasome non-ATPase regulatory subunit 14-like protein [Tanacetum coccineum]
MGTPTQVCMWSCPNFSAPAGRPFRCVKTKVCDWYWKRKDGTQRDWVEMDVVLELCLTCLPVMFRLLGPPQHEFVPEGIATGRTFAALKNYQGRCSKSDSCCDEVYPIQSVKGKVGIDVFRLINSQPMRIGQEPRQTTSNVCHLNKPSIQALIHGLNKQVVGKQPLLSFSRAKDNPMQGIQLYHSFLQPGSKNFKNSLHAAREINIQYVAFPAIPCDVFGELVELGHGSKDSGTQLFEKAPNSRHAILFPP